MKRLRLNKRMFKIENHQTTPDLKTLVRRHVVRTFRTRNFRARNVVVERGAVSKRQKREKSQRGEESGRVLVSGKQVHSVRKETHVVSVMIEHLLTDAIRDKKDNGPLLHQQPRHRQTERYPRKVPAAEGESFWNKRQDSVAKFPQVEVYVCIRHVMFSHPPAS